MGVKVNARYFINLDYNVPCVNVELESEDGSSTHIFNIEDVKILKKLLSKDTLEQYLLALENKMIEYSSSIVYDNSSVNSSVNLSKLAHKRDAIKDVLGKNN